jgi:methionyl-tRNA formyltransferase
VRIAFFGTPSFAVPSLDALVASRREVVGVVTQPDRPQGRGQRLTVGPVTVAARAHGIPILQPVTLSDPQAAASLRAWGPDIGVVVAYGQMIPAAMLDLPRHGLINVHASVLPAYRGAAPIHRAVMNGEVTTGVSIMRVAPKLDAGAVFAVRSCPIGADETSADVEARLSGLGAALLLEVLEAILAGRAVESPQDESAATYARKLTRDDSPLDWRRPALELHNQVRGLHPWPLASTVIAGARVIVHQTALGGTCQGTAPGVVAHVDKEHLTIAAGDGRSVALLRVQPEGRRAMATRDFLAGTRLSAGLPLAER